MIGKVCVTSLKVMTIPRMGLAAATLSVKLSILLKKELEILVNKDKSWTDSEVVQATLEMNQRGSIYLWQTEVNSSKVIQMNPSGITSVLNKTQQIMHQKGLMFVMMIKSKGGILDTVLWEPEATWDDNKIISPVNKKDPELKKKFAVSCHKAFRCFGSSGKSKNG